MNRLLSILITLVILFFIYLWISHLIKGPDRSGDDQELITDTVRQPPEEGPTYDSTHESNAQEETPAATGESESTEQVDQDETANGDSEDETEGESDETVDTPSEPAAPSSYGTHLVIAGNFLELANAQKHARRLQNLGFPNSEVVHFELSEYHTVCAGRFNDPAEARRVAKRITDEHGIDTYVRTGN